MNEDVIKGSFTRYVEKALKRSKRDYIKKQQRWERMEVPAEVEPLYSKEETGEEVETALVKAPEEMPWEAEMIKTSMRVCLGEPLWTAFSCLTDFEVLVVFAKVYRGFTFAEKGGRKNEYGGIVVLGQNWRSESNGGTIFAVSSFAHQPFYGRRKIL